MKNLMLILGAMLLIVGTTIIRGLTLSVLWGWFVVPLGVVAIGIPSAIGVALLVSLMTWQDCQTNKRGLGESFAVGIGQCLMAMLIGYVLTLFM